MHKARDELMEAQGGGEAAVVGDDVKTDFDFDIRPNCAQCFGPLDFEAPKINQDEMLMCTKCIKVISSKHGQCNVCDKPFPKDPRGFRCLVKAVMGDDGEICKKVFVCDECSERFPEAIPHRFIE